MKLMISKIYQIWKIKLILNLMLYPVAAFAINETNYQVEFQKKVLPYYQSGESQTFESFDTTRIHYHRLIKGNAKAIVILTGRTEPTNKYAEVVYDLKNLGYDFFLMDSRGQGHSQRLIPEDKHKQYIKKYQHWKDDLKLLFDLDITPRGYSEVVFLGHSMGGAIGLNFAESYPKAFSKIIVSSPMIELLLEGKNESLVYTAMSFLKLIGRGKSYIPGGDRGTFDNPFKTNRGTHSKVRHQMARLLEKEDEFLLMGAATVKWLIEGIQLGRKTYKNRKKLNSIPMLLFQAEDDRFSRYERQNKLCEKHPNCQKFFMEGSKHEMLMEKDDIRQSVLTKIKAFLKS